jgi:hypothetical protein
MVEFINIADLTDPNDPQIRSYREVNTEKTHNIPIGALVELESGARAFVVKHTRDCDQTPLYALAVGPDDCQFSMNHGYGEESLKQITSASTGPEKAPASDA